MSDITEYKCGKCGNTKVYKAMPRKRDCARCGGTMLYNRLLGSSQDRRNKVYRRK
jgi:ribosomal protein S27AE